MNIVIYDCVTGDALTEKYGRTGALMIDWLRPLLPGAAWEWVHVAGGAALPAPDEVDGILVSGSEKGVYDDTPWMQPLRDNLVAMRDAKVPMFGICFGHQIMADTFGGRAQKADKGFITGTRRFTSVSGERAAFLAHQDQVTSVPPGARVTASAPHCPVGALAYDFPAASVQFHPEYTPEFARDLIAMFGAGLMSPEQLQIAQDSLMDPVPSDQLAQEVAEFFRAHQR